METQAKIEADKMKEHKEVVATTPEEAVTYGYNATGYGKDKKAKGEAPDAAAAGNAQEAKDKKAAEPAPAPEKPAAEAKPIPVSRTLDENGRYNGIPKGAELSTSPAGKGDIWTAGMPPRLLKDQE